MPPDFALMGAYGVALKCLDEGARAVLDVRRLESYVSSLTFSDQGYRPLVDEGGNFTERHEEHDKAFPVGGPKKRGGAIAAYLGIDIGSISTNLAVLDEKGNLLAKRYLMTAGRPIEAVRQGLEEIAAEVGDDVIDTDPTAADDEVRREALSLIDRYSDFMEELSPHRALVAVWEFMNPLNKYIVTTEPWLLAKSDETRLATVMNHLVESLKIISVLIWPVMPETAEKIQGLLSLPRKGGHLGLQDIREWGRVKPSGVIAKAPHLFQKIGPESSKEGAARKRRRRRKKRL